MKTVERTYCGYTFDVDEPVAALVDALQDLAIDTFSSCGGHENPSVCQAPAGEWYVSLSLNRDDHGWAMFDWLVFLSPTLHDLQFTSWWNGPDDDIVSGGADFELRGCGLTSADEVARWLRGEI